MLYFADKEGNIKLELLNSIQPHGVAFYNLVFNKLQNLKN
jgi:hypothetical protein